MQVLLVLGDGVEDVELDVEPDEQLDVGSEQRHEPALVVLGLEVAHHCAVLLGLLVPNVHHPVGWVEGVGLALEGFVDGRLGVESTVAHAGHQYSTVVSTVPTTTTCTTCQSFMACAP